MCVKPLVWFPALYPCYLILLLLAILLNEISYIKCSAGPGASQALLSNVKCYYEYHFYFEVLD